MSLPLLGGGSGAGAIAGGAGTTASNFLARTSGLDGTHTTAYTDFLNGLDSDSLTAKFDALYIFATQDSTTAALNLMSSTFNATVNGSPTFTADRGFTGTNSSSVIYINTGFNPTSAASPKFVRDSAHLSLWNLANVTSSAYAIGCDNGSLYAGMAPGIAAQFLCPLNDATGNGIANADSRGHYIGNRSTSTAKQGYKNGSSVWTASPASTGLPNQTFYTLGENSAGSAFGAPYQLASASIGSSLSGTDATNFYNRLRTYMTAVGVP